MRIIRSTFGTALLGLLSAGPAIAAGQEGEAAPRNLAFVENKGQFTDQDGLPVPHVRYLLRTPGLSVLLRDHGFSYQLQAQADVDLERSDLSDVTLPGVSRIDIDFEAHEAAMVIRASAPLPFYQNYYLSQRDRSGAEASVSYTHVPGYRRVVYSEVVPGISIEFLLSEGDGPAFKYNIIAEPGADLTQLKFRYSGADPRVTNDELQLWTPTGHLDERIPKSWYGEEREQQAVKAGYVADAQDASLVGFAVDGAVQERAGKRLVIDPTPTWYWGTYLNGSDADTGRDVWARSVSGSTAVLVCGVTQSSNLATTGVHQGVFGGSYDGFLAKYDAAGTLGWVTYYGGTGIDACESVAMDPQGDIFLCGYTGSSTAIATVGGGVHQSTYGGVQDAFLAKFTSAGVRIWGTYYGGSSAEQGLSLALSGSDVFIGGNTQSASGIGTPGTYQPTAPGAFDSYVARFNGTNGSLMWGSYYGSPSYEAYGEVAVGPDGHVYLCGNTASTTMIATPGSHQPTLGGANDAFLAKLNGTTGQRIWGTYYGGTGSDAAFEIAVNCNGRVFIVGTSSSTNAIATTGAHQPTNAGGSDGFLACFSSAGALIWGTYYGTTNSESIYGVTVLGSGLVFVGGTTSGAGTGTEIATATSPQPTYGGGTGDGFLAAFSSGGVRSWGTYYGGSSGDAVYAVHTQGNRLYSTGNTTSSNNISTLNTLAPTTILSAFLGNHYAGITTDCKDGGATGMALAEVKSALLVGEEAPALTARPNPAQDVVTLVGAEWDRLASVEVIDVQGRACRLLRKGGQQLRAAADGIQADVQDLPPGIYTLRLLFTDGEQGTVKLAVRP